MKFKISREGKLEIAKWIAVAAVPVLVLVVAYRYSVSQKVVNAQRMVGKVRLLVAVHYVNWGENPRMDTEGALALNLPSVFTSLGKAYERDASFVDPFDESGGPIRYWTTGKFGELVILSAGPNRVVDCPPLSPQIVAGGLLPYCYDPTNGLLSGGDILHYGDAADHRGSPSVPPTRRDPNWPGTEEDEVAKWATRTIRGR